MDINGRRASLLDCWNAPADEIDASAAPKSEPNKDIIIIQPPQIDEFQRIPEEDEARL
jgi:hypothetical protein